MKLGIIGGGQLARMMVPPAHRLGIEVRVLENSSQSPAGLAGAVHVNGDWRDPEVCRRFAEELDVLTLDHEFTPVQALQVLEAKLLPRVSTMTAIADKLEQKRHLQKAGLLTAESREFDSPEQLQRIAQDFGYPLLVKARFGGYDGKGNFKLEKPEQLGDVFRELKGPLYAERFVDFQTEVAAMVARDVHGATVCYPVVETVQENHICVAVQFPADLPTEVKQRAEEVAAKAARAVDSVGVLGVEMFLRSDGGVVVNELAPRPHNSGHYTMDACLTCQFENHVRAVCGLPLGSVDPTTPAAVMINLLGDGHGSGYPTGLEEVLAHPRARVHLYGKVARPGRKLGHLTLVGPGPAKDLRAEAEALAGKLTFKETQRI